MTANVTFVDLARSLKPAKKATSSARIDSLSFSNCGDYLVTANDNDEIELYNVADGNSNRLLYSKKYGAGNIQFTHHHTQVIYSSTRGNDHAIRYHSLHHNAYIRKEVNLAKESFNL